MKQRDIIFFDLETTGVDTQKDRIVQIAAIKKSIDGKTLETKNVLVNPEMEIPQEAIDVHGITNEMVQDKPTFKQIAKGVRAFFEGCDLAGYNSDKFDVVLLDSELERVGVGGVDWEFNSVDVFNLYRRLYPNTLSDVYKRLTGKELENAHDALSDIEATMEILGELQGKHQGVEYEGSSPKDLEEFVNEGRQRVDVAGYFYKDGEDVVRWCLGKYKDQPVKGTDSGYISWFKGKMPKRSFEILKGLN